VTRDKFDESERPTGTLCLNCAGAGKIVVENQPGHFEPRKCAWCGGSGAMSIEQLAAWKSRVKLEP